MSLFANKSLLCKKIKLLFKSIESIYGDSVHWVPFTGCSHWLLAHIIHDMFQVYLKQGAG
jgi:hypothetical protein